ncbi:hypothetical protein SHVI106290_00765 [Shewanella violacea]|uniref:Uncharacterized protein n=1 Tax=Shewanella violacea (strain JCM 10179 / CIP 106290 / LMG 19151 / DSS12) TaxID=637905 RepID=D4ZG44_SHEVD|nr:hypothetical protein SVI_0672 [Shewanella violacea DSS12]
MLNWLLGKDTVVNMSLAALRFQTMSMFNGQFGIPASRSESITSRYLTLKSKLLAAYTLVDLQDN